MKYRTILADPPWDMKMTGLYKIRKLRPAFLVYPTMTLDQIKALPVGDLAEVGCHLWLWTTNQFIEAGFEVMRAWGFKYHAPIHWIKPSGLGNYFIHRTQTILFGYKDRCIFEKGRYRPNIITALPRKHSQKPEESYLYIEDISSEPRLELFARQKRAGWSSWGNEIASGIELSPINQTPVLWHSIGHGNS